MNRIRELRMSRGWKQDDLAARLHSKRQTISNYEIGARDIDAETICKLCDIFGCTSDYLLYRSPLPSVELSEEEINLLLAWRAADQNIKDGIDALLAPYRRNDIQSTETA